MFKVREEGVKFKVQVERIKNKNTNIEYQDNKPGTIIMHYAFCFQLIKIVLCNNLGMQESEYGSISPVFRLLISSQTIFENNEANFIRIQAYGTFSP
jgi:hypothetical protein